MYSRHCVKQLKAEFAPSALHSSTASTRMTKELVGAKGTESFVVVYVVDDTRSNVPAHTQMEMRQDC